MKRFLQYHVLTPHPVSNPNRGDDGLPKTAFVGGTWRGRKSSQNQKRVIRTSDEMRALGKHMGIRTKQVGGMLVEHLAAQQIDKPSAEAAARTIIEVLANKSEKPERPAKATRPKRGKVAEVKTEAASEVASEAAPAAPQGGLEMEQLVFLSPSEIEQLKAAALAVAKGGVTPKFADLLLKTDTAIDIGLFGRMLASTPDYNRVAAMQVAHAITTHKATVEDDYFTAMDDLNSVHEAAHLGERGFISGIFYTYMALDVPLLLSNLGGGESASPAAKQQALSLANEAIGAFTRAVVSASSPGMQASYASRTRAEYVRIERGDDQPFTGATAFDDAVWGTSGLLGKSIDQLRVARERATTRFELDYQAFEFAPDNKHTIKDLVAFATSNGR